jgi:hypothetical protein
MDCFVAALLAMTTTSLHEARKILEWHGVMRA